MKKVIGLVLMTILVIAAGVAAYDAGRASVAPPDASSVIAQEPADTSGMIYEATPVPEAEPTLPPPEVDVAAAAAPTVSNPTSVDEVEEAAPAGGLGAGTGRGYGSPNQNIDQGTGAQSQPLAAAGERVQYTGTVSSLAGNGFTLALPGGEQMWVQLGQGRFWQNAGFSLALGDSLTVEGFYENGQFQAVTVSNAAGQTLTLRDEMGRPLWAGGNGRDRQ